jgi:hypothetical protein
VLPLVKRCFQVALAIAFFITEKALPPLKYILDASPLTTVCRFVLAHLMRCWAREVQNNHALHMHALANVVLQIGKICLNKHLKNSGGACLEFRVIVFDPLSADPKKAEQYREELAAAYARIHSDLSVLYNQVLNVAFF